MTDDDHCNALRERQNKATKNNDVFKDSIIIPTGSTEVVQS